VGSGPAPRGSQQYGRAVTARTRASRQLRHAQGQDRHARPAQAALLEDLADRALRSEFEPVLCPEAPNPPRSRPACGAPMSVASTSAHATRYATRAQLAMETA